MDAKLYGIDKRNTFKNYTLGTYLAVNTKRLNTELEYIDLSTSIVNKENLQSLINDRIALYDKKICQKLATIYGAGVYKTYFDLYELAVATDKFVHLHLLEFIKEDGLRELYYAFKNNNENQTYKEGLFFEKLNKYRRDLISFEQFYEWTQTVVLEEAASREMRLISLGSSHNKDNLNESKAIQTESLIIKLPNFDQSITSSKSEFKDYTARKFPKNITKSKHDMFFGVQKSGIFFSSDKHLQLDLSNNCQSTFIGGSCGGSTGMLLTQMYQSLLNNKGFILFNFSNIQSMRAVYDLAYYFNRSDDVHTFFYGTHEFNDLELNKMIKHNKLVVVQFPELEKLDLEMAVEAYVAITNMLSTIKTKNKDEYTYNLYFQNLYYHKTIEHFLFSILDNAHELKANHINYMVINNISYHLPEDIVNYLVTHLDNSMIMRLEDEKTLAKFLNLKGIKSGEIMNLEPFEFFHFRHKKLENNKKYSGYYIDVPSLSSYIGYY